jgi:hypothetical protein
MFKSFSRVVIAGALLTSSAADGQSAIRLEPLRSVLRNVAPKVPLTTVHNYYGQCGGSGLQVLGVEGQLGTAFTVDSAATDQANLVVIAPGGCLDDLHQSKAV